MTLVFVLLSLTLGGLALQEQREIPRPPVIVARADWRCGACVALTRADTVVDCCDRYRRLWPVASALPVSDLQLRRAVRWNEVGPLDCDAVCSQLELLRNRPGYNGTECELLRFCEVGAQRLVRADAFIRLLGNGADGGPNAAAVAAKAAAKGVVAAVTAAVVPMSEQALRWLAVAGRSVFDAVQPQRWLRQMLIGHGSWSVELDQVITGGGHRPQSDEESGNVDGGERGGVVRNASDDDGGLETIPHATVVAAAAAAAAEAEAAEERRLLALRETERRKRMEEERVATLDRQRQERAAAAAAAAAAAPVVWSACPWSWLAAVAVLAVLMDFVQNYLADWLQEIPFKVGLSDAWMLTGMLVCNKAAQLLSFVALAHPVYFFGRPAFAFMDEARHQGTARAFVDMSAHAHSKPSVRCATHAFVVMILALTVWSAAVHVLRVLRRVRRSPPTSTVSVFSVVTDVDWVRVALRSSNPLLVLLTVGAKSPAHWWTLGQLFFLLELLAIAFALVQLLELERICFGIVRLVHFQLLIHGLKLVTVFRFLGLAQTGDLQLPLSLYWVSMLFAFCMFSWNNKSTIIPSKLKSS